MAAEDVRHRAHVVKGAAGAAGHQALVHPDAAVVHLAHQVQSGAGDLGVGLFLALVENVLGVGLQLGDGYGVAGMHGQGDGTFHRAQIHVYAAVVVSHLGRRDLLVGLGTAVDGVVVFDRLVGSPNGRPAGGFRGHDVDAVAVFNGQAGDAGSHKFHNFVLYITVGVYGADDGQGDVLRADAGFGAAGEVNGDDAGHGHVVGASHQLLGQFAAAFAYRHGAQSAVAGVGVGAQDHPAASGHHFPIVAVDNRHVGGNVDAAVLVGRGQGKHVIVFVNGAAYGAQRVVAVGQDVGHGKFFHAGSTGSLDNAHVGDVVAGQAVELHLQVLHVAAGVVGLQNAVGHGAFAAFLRRNGLAAQAGQSRRVFHKGLAVYQVDAAIVKFYHRGDLLSFFETGQAAPNPRTA